MSRKCDHDWFDHYKVSRGFQIETPFLSHVSGGAWNATPFWQLKIQPRNGVHSVDALVLYGNTIYSVRGILFNCISPDRTTACDTIRRADAYQSPRNPHCTIISSDYTQTQAFIYQSSTNSY